MSQASRCSVDKTMYWFRIFNKKRNVRTISIIQLFLVLLFIVYSIGIHRTVIVGTTQIPYQVIRRISVQPGTNEMRPDPNLSEKESTPVLADQHSQIIQSHATFQVTTYNLPYFLNAATFVDPRLSLSETKIEQLKERYPDSFATYYYNYHKKCTIRPLRTLLRETLDSFGTNANFHKMRLVIAATEHDRLSVQVSTNPFKISNETGNYRIREQVRSLSRTYGYNKILLIAQNSSNMEEYLKQLEKELAPSYNSILTYLSNGGYTDEDKRFFLLYKAKNLLVDAGTDGALAALTSSAEEGVHISPGINMFLSSDEYRHSIKLKEDNAHPILNLMGPVRPICCQFSTYGHGDSAKVFCSNARGYVKKPCWILSIGSKNQWGFENDVFKRTDCYVQVFDCTGRFQVPSKIQSRVQLHHLCVGIAGDKRSKYKSWEDIVNIGSTSSGLPKGTAPQVAKMDVEGWEFPVLSSLSKYVYDGNEVPKQLQFELHAITNINIGFPWVPIPESKRFRVMEEAVPLLFSNLSDIGYELIHRSDNPFCKHCSEVTLLHRSAFPDGLANELSYSEPVG